VQRPGVRTAIDAAERLSDWLPIGGSSSSGCGSRIAAAPPPTTQRGKLQWQWPGFPQVCARLTTESHSKMTDSYSEITDPILGHIRSARWTYADAVIISKRENAVGAGPLWLQHLV
jgi:hypothetical protein